MSWVGRLPSSHFNTVVKVGNSVLKVFRRGNANRRFTSERLSREWLAERRVPVIPISYANHLSRTIVMPFVASASESRLGASTCAATLVSSLSEFQTSSPVLIGWLDLPGRSRQFEAFSPFALAECSRYALQWGTDVLGYSSAAFTRLLDCEHIPADTCCPLDICPKNMVDVGGQIRYFDLESTMWAPREVLITRVMFNLLRDIGPTDVVREALESLDKHVRYENIARATLVWSLVRLNVYRKQSGIACASYHTIFGELMAGSNLLSVFPRCLPNTYE